MSELLFVAAQQPDGGFIARARDHPIFTQAASEEALHAAIRDAVHCHFDDGTPPEAIHVNISHLAPHPSRAHNDTSGPTTRRSRP